METEKKYTQRQMGIAVITAAVVGITIGAFWGAVYIVFTGKK
jgi:predicted Co/Zn/Cd cation transporter (cation efflux family)